MNTTRHPYVVRVTLRGLASLALAAGLSGCESHPHAATPSRTAGADATGRAGWSFENDAPGAAPAGFSFDHTGGGRAGAWVVREVADAPDGRRVLAQTDADVTDDRFTIAVADAPRLADLKLSVRGRPLSGAVDQVVGVVFRYRDEDNYYLARTNVLESNVRLYHVTRGRRQQIGSWKGQVKEGRWQSLVVEARGDHLTVAYDGTIVIDLRDATLGAPGRVGLWTKADSITEFDQLVAEPLAP